MWRWGVLVCVFGGCHARQAAVWPALDAPLASQVVSEGRYAGRDAVAAPDLVLLAVSEHAGLLEPCGCEAAPRGGVPRLGAAVSAIFEAEPQLPALMLHAGTAFSDQREGAGSRALSAEAVLRNEAMRQALGVVGLDVLNVSARDLPEAARAWPAAGVSANITRAQGDAVPGYLVLERGGRRVAVTGVTAPAALHLMPEGYGFADPVASVRALLPALEADLVVVLVAGPGVDVSGLAELPGVDVVIESGELVGRVPMDDVHGALWLRTRAQGQRLTELRLKLDAAAEIQAAVERMIELDPGMKGERSLVRLSQECERAVASGGALR